LVFKTLTLVPGYCLLNPNLLGDRFQHALDLLLLLPHAVELVVRVPAAREVDGRLPVERPGLLFGGALSKSGALTL
jgi:hypothetical protein